MTEEIDRIRKYLPLFLDLAKLLEAVPYGQVEATVNQHENKPVSMMVNASSKHRVKTNDEAVTVILSAVKMDVERGYSGTRSYSLVFDNGKINRVVQQGYEMNRY